MLVDRLELMFDWYQAMVVDQRTGRLLYLYDRRTNHLAIGEGEPLRDIASVGCGVLERISRARTIWQS